MLNNVKALNIHHCIEAIIGLTVMMWKRQRQDECLMGLFTGGT